MWWSASEICGVFISPTAIGNWNPPIQYKDIDGDFEVALQNIENDLNLNLEKIRSFQKTDWDIIRPYDYEGHAFHDDFLSKDTLRALATYPIYCFDMALTGLLAGNASLSAEGIHYAKTGMEIVYEYIPKGLGSNLENLIAKKISANAKAAGEAGAMVRHEPMRKLREWSVAKYKSGNFQSANQAAHQLKQEILQHGRNISAVLTEENAQRTIAEWFRKSV